MEGVQTQGAKIISGLEKTAPTVLLVYQAEKLPD